MVPFILFEKVVCVAEFIKKCKHAFVVGNLELFKFLVGFKYKFL